MNFWWCEITVCSGCSSRKFNLSMFLYLDYRINCNKVGIIIMYSNSGVNCWNIRYLVTAIYFFVLDLSIYANLDLI